MPRSSVPGGESNDFNRIHTESGEEPELVAPGGRLSAAGHLELTEDVAAVLLSVPPTVPGQLLFEE